MSSESWASPSDENANHINSAMESEKSIDYLKNSTDNNLGYVDLPSKELLNVSNNSIFQNGVCSLQIQERSLRNAHELLQEPQLEWIEEEMARVCGEENVSSDNDFKCSPLKSPPTLVKRKPALVNSPIKEMGIVSNDLKPVEKEMVRNQIRKSSINTINWKLVRMKHEALLEKKLKKAEEDGGTEKRAKLERRFKELFGEPTPSSDCKRKDEIAAFTVKHLMPMYKKQKIASKDLFKKLAKHISSTVLDKCRTPGEDDVRSRVNEYFCDGKCVNSEGDIFSI